MKKSFLILIFLLLLCACSVTASASGKPVLWVSPTGKLTVDAIICTEVRNNTYLFLPGNRSLDSLFFGFSADRAFLNGKKIVPGKTTAKALKLGQPNEIRYITGKKERTVTVTAMQGSRLPVMYITTKSGSLESVHSDKSVKESGQMILCNGDGGTVYDNTLKHIKKRGNASVSYAKKNYSIKLSTGKSLLDMGKAKRWALIGNYLDRSLIRNQITFDMARFAGLPFTPDQKQIDLYINHEYYGVYLLSEKIEVDDDRVDIRDLEKETEKLNKKELSSFPLAGSRHIRPGAWKGVQIPREPKDKTGGYIIEYEHTGSNYAEPSAYYTLRKMCLLIHSPEYCSEAQIRYISSFMQKFENAIFSGNGKDPETGKHYSEFVDMDSLVNKYLINEVSKNYDSNMSSEYFFKPADSVSKKAYAGPVWDMDNTYGAYSRNDNKSVLNPTGIFAGKGKAQYYWWPALYAQPDFYKAVVKRYQKTFVPAMEILLGRRKETDQLKSLDTYAAAIEKSAAMEYKRWPAGNKRTGKNLEENIEYLKNFVSKRMEFLNREWLGK